MTPLAILKYIVDSLQGTTYESWVNGFLFLVFFAAVYAMISFLLGRRGREFVVRLAMKTVTAMKNRQGYAPEFEAFRLRIEPYIELLGSSYFAFCGLYSAAVVGIAIAANIGHIKFLPLVGGLVWVVASFFYMRVNLEAASWAYHNIKNRRN